MNLKALPEHPGLHNRLLSWYDSHRRKLPWRERPSPYRTWISEIMLQQTQVATVLPYYERFLKRFPDAASLARASEAQVLRLWAGLGYYSRARNLHKAAKLIVARHAGRFPDKPEAILELPGIGRYTAGAILSIAFQKPFPVLDGNVMRVFSRLFGIRGDIKNSRIQKKMWNLAGNLMGKLNQSPDSTDVRVNKGKNSDCLGRPGDWNQALMELGALVCQPDSPLCDQCPLNDDCVAFKRGLQDRLPETFPGKKTVRLNWTCLWIENDGKVLLHKRADSERFLPGHWGLPESRHIKAVKPGPILATIRHTITCHQIIMRLRRAGMPSDRLSAEFQWVPTTKAKQFLVSSLWTKALAKAWEN